MRLSNWFEFWVGKKSINTSLNTKLPPEGVAAYELVLVSYYDLIKAKRSALMVAASVAGIPWGKPG